MLSFILVLFLAAQHRTLLLAQCKPGSSRVLFPGGGYLEWSYTWLPVTVSHMDFGGLLFRGYLGWVTGSHSLGACLLSFESDPGIWNLDGGDCTLH
jgi:hypothetical protein